MASSTSSGRFNHPTYLIRKKIFSLFGTKFHIYDPSGEVVFFSKMKSFKLREDIRLYTGEDMRTEVLTIKARRVLDFSTVYDVMDSEKNEKVGSLRRKGFKSMLKDEWAFMNPEDGEVGLIKEDNMLLAIFRRSVTNLIPQTYHGYVGETTVCTFKQHFNPLVLKMEADFSQDAGGLLDKRLGIAAAILLCGVEGRQE